MSRTSTIILSLAVAVAVVMVGTALFVGYTAMVLAGIAAFAMLAAVAWFSDLLC